MCDSNLKKAIVSAILPKLKTQSTKVLFARNHFTEFDPVQFDALIIQETLHAKRNMYDDVMSPQPGGLKAAFPAAIPHWTTGSVLTFPHTPTPLLRSHGCCHGHGS